MIVRSFFFFSSRRRHTRFDCDWSSDVCSSDLTPTSGWLQSAGRACARPRTCLPSNLGTTCGRSSQRAQCPSPCRSEEHTSELQSQSNLVCRLLLEKKKKYIRHVITDTDLAGDI